MYTGPHKNISEDDARNIVRQVYRLFFGEQMCLAARIESILRTAFPDPRVNAEQSAITRAVEEQVYRLAAQRLLANDSAVRLISETDIDRIVDAVLEADELLVQGINRSELRQRAGAAIADLFLIVVVVGGGDTYAGVWVAAQAIITAANEQDVNLHLALEPENALDFREFRAAVLAGCMTHEAWMLYARVFIDMFNLDDTLDAIVWKQVIEISRAYFVERALEVWPSSVD